MRSKLVITVGAALTLTVAIATSTALAANSSSFRDGTPAPTTVPEGYIGTQAEFDAAYADELAHLPAFPSSSKRAAQAGGTTLTKGQIAQVGVAEGDANIQWLCAWEGDYVAAVHAGETERAETALRNIASWESLPWTQEFFVDPDRGWHSRVVVPAENGDPSGVEEDLATCA